MKQRSLTTGTVHGEILISQQDGDLVRVAVDSSAWFAWLQRAASFRFRDEEGYFIAHKTHAGNRRGGSYWRATRRRHGRLYSF
jgi:LuxR family transcriptional regulator, maltose regulon positive regulatory protein